MSEINNLYESYLSIYDEGYRPMTKSKRERIGDQHLKSFVGSDGSTLEPSRKNIERSNKANNVLRWHSGRRSKKKAEDNIKRGQAKKKTLINNEYIVNYLVDEGYARSLESAQNMFSVMSEEWIQDIEEFFLLNSPKKKKETSQTHTASSKNKRKAKELIDAAIAKRDAERASARRKSS